MDKQEWQEHLARFLRERRAQAPVPEAAEISEEPLLRWQYRVEGGFMQTWCRQHGPQMLRERRALLEFKGVVDPDPIVVIHGDMPLLAACRVLLEDGALEGEGAAVAMLDAEYDAFLAAHPEPREFDHHVRSWSRFVPAEPALLDQARALGHTLSAGLSYFNHVNGTLWGPRCGLNVENLWSWDGQQLALVEEAIRHARY